MSAASAGRYPLPAWWRVLYPGLTTILTPDDERDPSIRHIVAMHPDGTMHPLGFGWDFAAVEAMARWLSSTIPGSLYVDGKA